jgi:hypothetical protein
MRTAEPNSRAVLKCFLQSNVTNLSSSSGSPQYAWKWIPLADRLKPSEVAQACITDLPEGVWADPAIVLLIADQPDSLVGAELAQMSLDTYQRLLKMVENNYKVGVLAQQEAARLRDDVHTLKQQMKPGSAYCRACRQLTEHKRINSLTDSHSVCRGCHAQFRA